MFLRLGLSYIRKVKMRKAKGVRELMSFVKTLTSVKSHLSTNMIFFFPVCHHYLCSQWSCVTAEDVHYFSWAVHRLVESHMHVTSGALSVGIWLHWEPGLGFYSLWCSDMTMIQVMPDSRVWLPTVNCNWSSKEGIQQSILQLFKWFTYMFNVNYHNVQGVLSDIQQ